MINALKMFCIAAVGLTVLSGITMLLPPRTPEQVQAAMALEAQQAAGRIKAKPKAQAVNPAALEAATAVLRYETIMMELHQGGWQ